MSYWDRPFFPEWCDAILDDHITHDTMVRIAGSWAGISQVFKVIADHYGWTHIVLLTDEDASQVCWYGGKPFDEVFGHEDNYTFTWLRLTSKPTDEQLDDVLEQIRSLTRGLWYRSALTPLCSRRHSRFCKDGIGHFRLTSTTPTVKFWFRHVSNIHSGWRRQHQEN